MRVLFSWIPDPVKDRSGMTDFFSLWRCGFVAFWLCVMLFFFLALCDAFFLCSAVALGEVFIFCGVWRLFALIYICRRVLRPCFVQPVVLFVE
jgi:hypothetical protein